MGELAQIEDELRTHRDVLELGCGTGRLCAHMLKLGLDVTGVDESAEMLAHMPSAAERLQSPIEGLNLDRKWAAVVLPSHMVNHPDPKTRSALVLSARNHLNRQGTLYVSCYPQRWLERIEEGALGGDDGLRMSIENLSRDGSLVSMRVRYATPGGEWTHEATAATLSKDEIEELLRSVGLSNFRWFEQRYVWVAASAGDA